MGGPLEGLTHEGDTPGSETDKEPRSNRTRFIVVAAVVILALGYMVYAAFPGNALYFLTVDELLNKDEVHDGRLLRVSGKLVDGSFQRQERSTTSSFRLHDKELGLSGVQLDAEYVGVLPDLFFNPHSEIILEGSYGLEQVFHADSILVKCPSKYKSLQEEASQGDVPGGAS
jgi:cytochrome c-type biogenesis protein CcmE